MTDRFYWRSALFCFVVNALFGAWLLDLYGNAIVFGERIG